MEFGTLVGIISLVATLFLGGIALSLAGYAYRNDAPRLAVVSYVVGAGFVAGGVLSGIFLLVRAIPPSPIVAETRAPSPNLSASRTENRLPASLPTPEANVTPQYLVDLWKNRTKLQAETLVNEYIGKSLKVSGKVYDIRNGYGADSPVIVSFRGKDPLRDPALYMQFDKTWKDRLSVLKLGDQITVVGKIDKISDSIPYIDLVQCEIVDYGTAP